MSFLSKGILYGTGYGMCSSVNNILAVVHVGPSTPGDIDLVTINGSTAFSLTTDMSSSAISYAAAATVYKIPVQANAVLQINMSSGAWYGWVDKIRASAETAPTLANPGGYFYRGAVLNCNTIDKLDYGVEVVTQVSSWLFDHADAVGLSDNTTNLAGYAFGGTESFVNVSTIRKYTYSTDTHALLSGQNLSAVLIRAASISDTTRGHIAGGNTNGTASTLLNKFVYSTQVCSTSGSTLPSATRSMSGVSSSTNGYLIGGNNNSDTALTSIYKVVHSTSTVSTLGAVLAAINGYCGMGSSSSTDGYSRGGTGYSSQINKFNFAGETVSLLQNTYAYATKEAASVDTSSSGYFKLGADAGGSALYSSAAMDKLTFANDTLAMLHTSLRVPLVQNATTGRFATFTRTA